MPIVHQLLADSLVLTDPRGIPIAGADLGDFTATARLLGSSPLVTASVTITEAGGGEYDTRFTPTQIGTWRLAVNYDDGTIQRGPFVATYEVTQDLLSAPVAGYGAGTVGAKIAAIGSATVVTAPAVPLAADRVVTRGNDEALSWSSSTWDIPVDASVTFSVAYAGIETTFGGARVSPGTVTVDLTSEQTTALVPGRRHYRYALKANDDVLVTGVMSVELA